MKSPYGLKESSYYTIIKENMPEVDIGVNAWFLVLAHASDSWQYHKIYESMLNLVDEKSREHIEIVFYDSLSMLANDFYDDLENLDSNIEGTLIELVKTRPPDREKIISLMHGMTGNSMEYAFSKLGKDIPKNSSFQYFISDMLTMLLGLLCYRNNMLIPVGSAALSIFSKNYNRLVYVADMDFDSIIDTKISLQNKEKAKSRWSKHNETRPEKKKQYLDIMDQQNFTTFAETAEYIKQHIETDKKPSYDTIKRWLSQASKGNFS